MPDKVSAKQLQLIHIAVAQLGLDDETYRSYMERSFKVRSSKDLSYDEATRLIDQFKKWGFRIKTKRTPCAYICGPRKPGAPLPENVLVLVSPQQLLKIRHLVEDIHWKHFDGYQRWLKKYFGLDKIKYSLEASRVMEGLKGLWMTQNKCACGLTKERNA